jgi:hypothetical protein
MQKLKTLGATLAGVVTFVVIFLALKWSTQTALALANALIYRGQGGLPPVLISTVLQGCKILGVLGAMLLAYRLGGRRLLPAGFVLAIIFFYIISLLVSRFEPDWLQATSSLDRWRYGGNVLFFVFLLWGGIFLVVKALQKRRSLTASTVSKTDEPAT